LVIALNSLARNFVLYRYHYQVNAYSIFWSHATTFIV
jgi:hypothetical protein